jgi:pimeloyl-ACP methyl ester carboxylesterase
MIAKLRATIVDAAMCASMNFVQARHRLAPGSRGAMEDYVQRCEELSPAEYFDYTHSNSLPAIEAAAARTYSWQSPLTTRYSRNDTARVDLFPCAKGWQAPTVLMLHALMSATDIGYKRWAARWNALGWNACFLHLPYHYSRVPAGHWNGELAITADLIRNAEGLRQGVMEVRQLMFALRKAGCTGFGLLGTSYGAWIAALTCAVEPDIRFAALMAPIVNVEQAIWRCPASMMMRRHLRKAGIDSALVSRHFHLSSPLHMTPLVPTERILLVAGDYDLVAPPDDIAELSRRWSGAELLRIPQGHFGYRMMRDTFARLQSGYLKIPGVS